MRQKICRRVQKSDWKSRFLKEAKKEFPFQLFWSLII